MRGAITVLVVSVAFAGACAYQTTITVADQRDGVETASLVNAINRVMAAAAMGHDKTDVFGAMLELQDGPGDEWRIVDQYRDELGEGIVRASVYLGSRGGLRVIVRDYPPSLRSDELVGEKLATALTKACGECDVRIARGWAVVP